jgi:glycosyltransferase involved in cell wall biosynthesis
MPQVSIRPTLVVLKSPDYAAERARSGRLPYGIDYLEGKGFELVWSDGHLRGPTPRWVRVTERLVAPWRQAWSTRRARRDAVATVAMFESEGHALALWRALTGRRGPPLVIVACWLADLAAGDRRRRALYRLAYRGVDAVVVFSSNQRPLLAATLGLPEHLVHTVTFGVDLRELEGRSVSRRGPILAVGRDRGRDWATLLSAATGRGWTIDLVTRPDQLDGLTVPPNVTVQPPVPRDRYLDLLADSSLVVVPTVPRAYPTGQSVLLEAMALGKACVTTDTGPMREYVIDGVTGVLVPPGDADALARAIGSLIEDPTRAEQLGRSAAAWVAEHHAGVMWGRIAQVIAECMTGTVEPSGGASTDS